MSVQCCYNAPERGTFSLFPIRQRDHEETEEQDAESKIHEPTVSEITDFVSISVTDEWRISLNETAGIAASASAIK